MRKLERVWKVIKGKGKVKNYSSIPLWVLETDKGYPMAHRLAPNHKSPNKTDSDAFRRIDDKPIRGHGSWWKIVGHVTAKIYSSHSGLKVLALYMRRASDRKFAGKGKIKYDNNKHWGVPMRNVISVSKDKKGRIKKYLVEGYGWLSKSKAINMAAHDLIDNAAPVFPKGRSPYLRSYPDKVTSNNFSELG